MRIFCSTFALAAAFAASSAQAQAPVTMTASARSSPGGAVVATLLPGARVVPGEVHNGAVFVILEGWIDEKRLGGPRDSFPASVGGKLAMRVHTTASKNGKVIAELHAGSGVTVVARSGGWVKVRRGLWIPAKAIGAVTSEPNGASREAGKARTAAQKAAAPKSAPSRTAPSMAAPSKAVPPAPVRKSATPVAQAQATPPAAGTSVPAAADTAVPVPPGAFRAPRGALMQSSPTGTTTATLAPGAFVEPLIRDRGWVKVRMEGWVNERDLVPTDSDFNARLTAADLRANPEGTRGKIVRWEVQLLSLQYADPLRRDLARDEPYFLARGPGAENSLLYLAVPPSMLKDAKTLAPLTTVIITARVRTGRSDPGGTPILDLQSLAKR